MNSWSRNRKRIILGIVILALLVLVGGPAYLIFHQTPTCSDGVKNGDETGIDCGGSCRKLCTVESLPLIIKGDPRVIRVRGNEYEVVAVLENSNLNAEIGRARYRFQIYSAESAVPIKTISGETFVPRGATFAIFEGPVDFTEVGVPARATLEWEEASIVWERQTQTSQPLVVDNFDLRSATSSPRLEAVVKNESLQSVANVELTALLYDNTGSIFAVSKTFITRVEPTSETPVIFTWPEALSSEPVEIKILTRILPDTTYLH